MTFVWNMWSHISLEPDSATSVAEEKASDLQLVPGLAFVIFFKNCFVVTSVNTFHSLTVQLLFESYVYIFSLLVN